MNWMFVSLPKSYVEALTTCTAWMVFVGTAISLNEALKVTLHDRISVLFKEKEISISCEDTARWQTSASQEEDCHLKSATLVLWSQFPHL